MQIAAAEEATAAVATGEAASEAAVGSVVETVAAMAAAEEEDMAAAATKWEEGQYLWVQRCSRPPGGASAQSMYTNIYMDQSVLDQLYFPLFSHTSTKRHNNQEDKKFQD